jgi:hypothetical protein
VVDQKPKLKRVSFPSCLLNSARMLTWSYRSAGQGFVFLLETRHRKVLTNVCTLYLAVDYVQEHILHQGTQKNESALEQAKDAKVADTIRHMAGLDKDKDKKH